MRVEDVRIGENINSLSFILIILGVSLMSRNIMSCRVQRYMKHPIVRNIILFNVFLLVSQYTGEDANVGAKMIRAVIMYAIFIMFIKSDYRFMIASLILFSILLFLHNETERLKSPPKSLKDARTSFEWIFLVSLILGFVVYFLEQYKKHEQFSYLKFVFGVHDDCKMEIENENKN